MKLQRKVSCFVNHMVAVGPENESFHKEQKVKKNDIASEVVGRSTLPV